MAYTDNFPQRPVFMADFANGGKIDPRATFTRASTANVWDGSKHLSSENLVVQSQDLDTTWTVFSGTPAVTGGQAAPDGTSTGWLITAQTASSAISQAQQSVSSVGASKTYTLSAYLKAGTASHTYMTLRGSGSVYGFVEIDWADPLNPRVATRTFASASATVTAVGSGGWYRVALTTTTDASTSSGVVYIGPSDGTTQNANGYPVWNSSGETALAWGVQLEQRGSATTYNPTTTQIHREYAPSLVSKSNNVGRFDYSTDGQSVAKGILIEGQVQNLFGYTEDFTQSDWTPTTTTFTTGAAVAPSGDLTANLVVPNSGASFGQFYQTETLSSGTVYTLSFFVKNAGWGSGISVFFGTTGPWGSTGDQRYAQFNLTTGEAVLESGGVTGFSEDVGNGWRRYSVTTPATTVTTSAFPGLAVVNLSGSSITGDGYSGVLAWGAQLVPLSFSGSYVGSSSSSGVTKAAEQLSVATADIPGFSEGVGTVVYETGGVASATAANQLAWSLFSSTTANSYTMAGVNVNGPTDTSVRVYVRTPDGAQAFLNTGTVAVGDSYKMACRYELDNVAASLNGGAIVSDTSGTVPVGIDTLWIGQRDGANHLNSNLKRIAVYNEALSDTNLQALTS